jgi:hypothetical protein
MTSTSEQRSLFDELTPAQQWDEKITKRALDELFDFVKQYRKSDSYKNLLKFVARFHFYSPYNAMLVHIQMPGATFVATASRWKDLYRRSIKPNARPLVILQPMGPVMFVFDVGDTEPSKDSPPLPKEIYNPFEVLNGKIGIEFEKSIENAIRDGVRIQTSKDGSQSAGSIQVVKNINIPPQLFYVGKDKQGNKVYIQVYVKFDIIVNKKLSRETQYTTIIHELAHLYLGHLGTINPKWWPDRRGIQVNSAEFEAESVTYLVCKRFGIIPPSEEYLSGYLKIIKKFRPSVLNAL